MKSTSYLGSWKPEIHAGHEKQVKKSRIEKKHAHLHNRVRNPLVNFRRKNRKPQPGIYSFSFEFYDKIIYPNQFLHIPWIRSMYDVKRLFRTIFSSYFYETSWMDFWLAHPSPEDRVKLILGLFQQLSELPEPRSACRPRKIGGKNENQNDLVLGTMTGRSGIYLQSFVKKLDNTNSEEQLHTFWAFSCGPVCIFMLLWYSVTIVRLNRKAALLSFWRKIARCFSRCVWPSVSHERTKFDSPSLVIFFHVDELSTFFMDAC